MIRKKIFALLSLLAAFLCLWFDGYIVYFSLNTGKFVKSEALFLERDGRKGFIYKVGDKKFFSTYYSVVDYIFHKNSLDENYFRKGEKVVCYYSPKNPNLAFIKKGLVIEKYFLTSLLLTIVFIAIAWQYWKDDEPESCGLG
jgi:hypothetical protein